MIEGFTLAWGVRLTHVFVWVDNGDSALGFSVCGTVASRRVSDGWLRNMTANGTVVKDQREIYDVLTSKTPVCYECEKRLADPTNHPYVVRNHNREKVPPVVVVDVQQPTVTTFKDIMSVAVADLQQSTSEEFDAVTSELREMSAAVEDLRRSTTEEFDAVTSELREICRYLKDIGDDLKSVRIASILQYADLGSPKVGEAREQVDYLMEHQHGTDLHEYK